MSGIKCGCRRPHIRRVHTSSISIFGEGVAWLAARPGGTYLVGHGFHFDTWQDALKYALGGTP